MYHEAVLLNESVQGLNIKPNGLYVDVTFGAGGHSKAILALLESGKLFAFDQDADASKNILEHQNFKLLRTNFSIKFPNTSHIDNSDILCTQPACYGPGNDISRQLLNHRWGSHCFELFSGRLCTHFDFQFLFLKLKCIEPSIGAIFG